MSDVRVVAKEYLHLSNSGVTFRVIDEGYGPTITINTNTFDGMYSEIKLRTNTESLRVLSEMFLKASMENFSPEDHSICRKIVQEKNDGDCQNSLLSKGHIENTKRLFEAARINEEAKRREKKPLPYAEGDPFDKDTMSRT